MWFGGEQRHLSPQRVGAAVQEADCEDGTLGLVMGTPPPAGAGPLVPDMGLACTRANRGPEQVDRSPLTV